MARLRGSERGTTATEYALILALLVAGSLLLAASLRNSISDPYAALDRQFQQQHAEAAFSRDGALDTNVVYTVQLDHPARRSD